MDEVTRGFRGVWIPKQVWLDKRLRHIDKVLLAEIESLDSGDGCFASNKYFAEFFGVTPWTISKSISRLRKADLIRDTFKGPRRRLSLTTAPVTDPPPVVSTPPSGCSSSAEEAGPGRSNIDPECRLIAADFLKLQAENHPTLIRQVDDRKIDQSARVVEQAVRLDKVPRLEIRAAVMWAAGDSFWTRNLLSLASLRNKGRNGETKLTNILASMERESPRDQDESDDSDDMSKEAKRLQAALERGRPGSVIRSDRARKELQQVVNELSTFLDRLPGKDRTHDKHLTHPIQPGGAINPDYRANPRYLFPTLTSFVERYAAFVERHYVGVNLTPASLRTSRNVFSRFRWDVERKAGFRLTTGGT